jgi:E3 SUMO-protein ligase PIAS1
VVKIPLTCTLSTEKIKLPARGIFCNHYQCFDLQNFLMMISQSANPRWVCPLCKLPSYMFRIDCILLAILEKFAQHPLTEVMLFKSGDFTVNAGDNPVTEKTINISELPIESLAKRAASSMVEPERKKKKTVTTTEAKQVIAIDLD